MRRLERGDRYCTSDGLARCRQSCIQALLLTVSSPWYEEGTEVLDAKDRNTGYIYRLSFWEGSAARTRYGLQGRKQDFKRGRYVIVSVGRRGGGGGGGGGEVAGSRESSESMLNAHHVKCPVE